MNIEQSLLSSIHSIISKIDFSTNELSHRIINAFSNSNYIVYIEQYVYLSHITDYIMVNNGIEEKYRKAFFAENWEYLYSSLAYKMQFNNNRNDSTFDLRLENYCNIINSSETIFSKDYFKNIISLQAQYICYGIQHNQLSQYNPNNQDLHLSRPVSTDLITIHTVTSVLIDYFNDIVINLIQSLSSLLTNEYFCPMINSKNMTTIKYECIYCHNIIQPTFHNLCPICDNEINKVFAKQVDEIDIKSNDTNQILSTDHKITIPHSLELYLKLSATLNSHNLKSILKCFPAISIDPCYEIQEYPVRNFNGGWDYNCKYIYTILQPANNQIDETFALSDISDRHFYVKTFCKNTIECLFNYFILQVLLDNYSMAYNDPPYHHYSIILETSEIEKAKSKLKNIDFFKYQHFINGNYPYLTFQNNRLFLKILFNTFNGIELLSVEVNNRQYFSVIESLIIEKDPNSDMLF